MADRHWQELDGDAAVVLKKGNTYTEIAHAIQRSMTSLQNIIDDTNTTAKSMDATRKLAGDVLEDITKTLDRYTNTGEALVTYAGVLGPAITDSATAATKLHELRGDLAHAEMRQRYAESHEDGLPADAPAEDRASAQRDKHAADSDVSHLHSQITYWEGEWNDAKSRKDLAARTARDSIDEVVNGSLAHGLKDSTWDKIKHIASSIYKAFKIVCDIAGVLAIFFSWVPILGQVLLVLGAIGSILSIVESIVQFAKGEIGFGKMLLGVGLGVIGLFGGKIATNLGKLAKARAITKAVAATNSEARLATRLAGNVDEGMRMISEASETMGRSGELLSLKTILKSPFTLSDEAADVGRAFSGGQLNFAQAFAKNAKNVFVYPLKSPFGDTGSMLRNPAIYYNADKLLPGAVAANLVSFGGDVVSAGQSLVEDFGGDDPWKSGNSVIGIPSPVIDGPYVKLAQLPGNVVGWANDIDGMF